MNSLTVLAHSYLHSVPLCFLAPHPYTPTPPQDLEIFNINLPEEVVCHDGKTWDLGIGQIWAHFLAPFLRKLGLTLLTYVPHL